MPLHQRWRESNRHHPVRSVQLADEDYVESFSLYRRRGLMTAVGSTLSLSGEALPVFSARPRDPVAETPTRRPGSVRRTSTIHVDWPEGREEMARLSGRARDIVTPLSGGDPTPLAEDAMEARAEHRLIRSVVADPPRASLTALAGARAGGHLRAAIDEVLHEERVSGSPLYLLLDDLAGTTLIAGWAWTQWRDQGAIAAQRAHRAERVPQMEGVCIGFRPGSVALDLDADDDVSATFIPPLVRPDDPLGWHAFPTIGGPNLRRARRIDVWREDGAVRIDATFQDSGATPEGRRSGLHEYRISATADPAGKRLTALEALPHILPYPECPAATVNMHALVGLPLADMRSAVLQLLRKTAGCTHLNDALRALAEVPRLVAMLPAGA